MQCDHIASTYFCNVWCQNYTCNDITFVWSLCSSLDWLLFLLTCISVEIFAECWDDSWLWWWHDSNDQWLSCMEDIFMRLSPEEVINFQAHWYNGYCIHNGKKMVPCLSKSNRYLVTFISALLYEFIFVLAVKQQDTIQIWIHAQRYLHIILLLEVYL